MLLAAVPESLKGELISSRQLGPQAIFYNMLKTYQPGGLIERSQTLMSLTATKEAVTPQEAVEDLRMWRRHLLRADELKAALPASRTSW